MAWRSTLEMWADPVAVATVVAVLFGVAILSSTSLDAWLAAGCFPW